MKRHHATTTATLLVALALAAPSAAGANSLLSGYGGPGEGNQAILGSALINGPGGGSGSSSSGGGAGQGATGAGAPAGVTGASATGTQRGSASGSRGGSKASSSSKASGRRSHASAQGSRAYEPASRPSPSRSAVESSHVGLSDSDLLYVLLAFGVLVLAGTLTRRLTRPVA